MHDHDTPSSEIPATRPLSGLWLPLITPFRDGRLDTVSLQRLIGRYLGEPGTVSVDGLIVAATTGEGLTLTEEETAELVTVAARTIADTASGPVPLYLGLSGSDTAQLAATIARTAQWPIDGYLISCPYYSRPSQTGLHDHFATLADATDRPVVIYNIPYRTGVNLANDTLLALASRPNIVGLKDCCADPAQSFDLLRRLPDGFSVMTGEDAQYYTALVHGAQGAILASAHVETAKFANVHNRLIAGDQPGALRQWSAIADLAPLLFAEPSPAAIKHWLWREGDIDSPELRLPMTGVSAGLADRIDAEMVARGVLAENTGAAAHVG